MRTILTCALTTIAVLASMTPGSAVQTPAPLRLAIAGLVHGHVGGFLRGAQGRQDVQIVGAFDPERALLDSYAFWVFSGSAGAAGAAGRMRSFW